MQIRLLDRRKQVSGTWYALEIDEPRCANFSPAPAIRSVTTRDTPVAKMPGAAIVDTVNEGHSLSEHAQPLRSVHANRTSGATR